MGGGYLLLKLKCCRLRGLAFRLVSCRSNQERVRERDHQHRQATTLKDCPFSPKNDTAALLKSARAPDRLRFPKKPLPRIVAYCIKDFERKNKGVSLSDNHRALRRLRTQCERAKRTLSSSTTATIEIDSLMDGVDFSCTLSRYGGWSGFCGFLR